MRNIAVFTGNRADASPLQPVINALKDRSDLETEVLDVPLGHTDITLASLTHDLGALVSRVGNRFCGRRPDILVVLGDRIELLSVCQAAVGFGIPIAHIHGGETTAGAFDDKIRHAVSQLADLHFTAAPLFTDKLVSMGIPKDRIFTVGAPSLDDLETDETCEFGEGFFLVTLHPETAGRTDNRAMTQALMAALGLFPDHRVVVTASNDDPGGRDINAELMAWCFSGPARKFMRSLGRRRYLTAMKHAAFVIGNSSSGIIEAPALGTPTVNIGRRQEGRPMAYSVISRMTDAAHIESGIHFALSGEWLRGPHMAQPTAQLLPYGTAGASTKIAEVLATWPM